MKFVCNDYAEFKDVAPVTPERPKEVDMNDPGYREYLDAMSHYCVKMDKYDRLMKEYHKRKAAHASLHARYTVGDPRVSNGGERSAEDLKKMGIVGLYEKE